MSESCKTCRFWKANDSTFGSCRRMPPTTSDLYLLSQAVWEPGEDRLYNLRHEDGLSWVPVPDDIDRHSQYGFWPESAEDDWCGEYQPAKRDE